LTPNLCQLGEYETERSNGETYLNSALEKNRCFVNFIPSFVTLLATVAENSLAAKRERVEAKVFYQISCGSIYSISATIVKLMRLLK
jgi:hypothetical protein